MRIIDIGIAAGYAVLCISLISVLNPYSVEGAGVTALSDSRASSALVAYVQAVGLPFLGTAPPANFCSSLQASSNSTIILGGETEGDVCRPAPQYSLGTSSFELMISGRQVVIEAWVEGQ